MLGFWGIRARHCSTVAGRIFAKRALHMGDTEATI